MPGHLKGRSGPFRLHTRRASGINKQLETEACFQMTIEKNRHESDGYLLNGGDERIRTADPLLAKQVLSQLSYTPKMDVGSQKSETKSRKLNTTSGLLLPRCRKSKV